MIYIYRKTIFSILFVALNLTLSAQFDLQWQDIENLGGNDQGILVETVEDSTTGDIVVYTLSNVEYNALMNVTARSADGVALWSTDLSDPDFSFWSASSFIIDNSGSAIISGQAFNSVDSRYEIFIAKLNPSGDVDWIETYHTGDNYNYFNGFTASNDGSSYYLTGRFNFYGGGGSSALIFTFFNVNAADGSIVEENELVLPGRFGYSYGMVGDDSGVYMFGYVSDADFGNDAFILKFDFAGELIWFKDFNTNYGGIYDASINSDGNIVCGLKRDSYNYRMLCLSPAGDLIYSWDYEFIDGSSFYSNMFLESDNSGNTYAVLEVYNYDTGSFIYVAKLNDSGDLLQEYELNDRYVRAVKFVDEEDESLHIAASNYYEPILNYVPTMHELNPDGSVNQFLFGAYKGYSTINDFSSTDGITFYFTGGRNASGAGLPNTLNACWDDLTMRLAAPSLSDEIEFFPNPVSDYLTIPGNQGQGILSIYNASGQLIERMLYTGETLQINSNSWASGQYLIEIKSETQKSVQQVVKL